MFKIAYKCGENCNIATLYSTSQVFGKLFFLDFLSLIAKPELLRYENWGNIKARNNPEVKLHITNSCKTSSL